MGTQDRREREKEQRKQLIRACAQEIFRHKGFGGTTIRDLAQACELATGTIYLYYRDKNELLADLLVEGHELLLDELRQALAAAGPEQQWEKLIDVFFRFAAIHPEHFELMFFVVQREGYGVLDVVPKRSPTHHRLQEQQQECLRLAALALRDSIPTLDDQTAALTSEAAWSMLAGVVYFFRKEGQEIFEPVAQQAKNILRGYVTATVAASSS